MFRLTAQLVRRFWPWLLVVWIAVLAGLWWAAPRWSSVAEEGEFEFLPPESPTRRGEALLKKAFPEERDKSSVVLVLTRADDKPLTEADKSFITGTLEPRLQKLAGPPASETSAEVDAAAPLSAILEIDTFANPVTGPLLISADERATLVNIDLSTDFLDLRNRQVVARIEEVVERLKDNGEFPPGLNVAFTGSAAVGRDQRQAKARSVDSIHAWTIWLVVILLLIVYRAPLLAVIPLVTLFVAVETTMKLTALLAGAGYVGVFSGQEVYTTVIVYGAGVDFSLFLLSRYQEEVQNGLEVKEAVDTSIRKVGTAIAASATTQIFGIGMLCFMSFRKFQQAGFSIALGFLMMLLASLLLTPALLCLTGRFAFWPFALSRSRSPNGDEASRTLGASNSEQKGTNDAGRNIVWEWIGRGLRKWPGTAWLVTVLVLLPFAVTGVRNADHLSYGIVSELPADSTSLHGTDVLTQHFPAGKAGAVTLLIRNDDFDFSIGAGENAMRAFTSNLWARRQELKIADIRGLGQPRGFQMDSASESERGARGEPVFARLLRRSAERRLSQEHYVSGADEFGGHVTRVKIVLDSDPFARQTIDRLGDLRDAIRKSLPDELAGSTIFLLGSTANLRDLKSVAERDRRSIQILATTVVLLIMVVMLRRIVIPVYLIVTVLFGFFVTIGATYLVFEWWQGARFAGLDWTVPIFVFTVLIAVGEDYNIFLVTRIDEEQETHGPVGGITRALSRTGGIISGCGIIMAGTFTSLVIGGKLAGMQQLGFALAFGVLLDTFVVRTILVPAYLILVNEGRFGRLSRWLGGITNVSRSNDRGPDDSSAAER